MKPPNHPAPSGDRAMGRALLQALEHAGCATTLASDLRCYDGSGDAATQRRLIEAAKAECARVVSLPQAHTWQAWITYHNYYKAPDLIGPNVAQALSIPYIQIESTRARKRLTGPWASFATAAESAADAARAILYFTHHDAETLRRDAPAGQALHHLAPFLPRTTLPKPSTLNGPMLCVAMMRPGDKIASYQLLAETLSLLPSDLQWQLDVVGDGPARSEVETLLAPFGPRITLHGALDSNEISAFYAQASLLFWPGVNEAFGMVYLEAQAAGVPVVAQDRPGVRDVVVAPRPEPEAGPKAMAERLHLLLTNDTAREDAAANARTAMSQHHLLPTAAATLRKVLQDVTQ